ncbi:hypothetical protein LCGC14_0270660 [marine sediment metagenome]|uniref:Helicase ATP-binding domain-containing protein n=1 Tax=marine sediment metagenome TaxID=412755 RepID=A0A0F9UFP8_9ZZZZ
MADTTDTKDTPVQMVSWVTFPKKQALLKRLIDDKGNPGLILRVAENEEGAAVAKMAQDGGFKLRSSGSMLTMIFERGKPIPYKTSQIAQMIGGELTRMPRERLMSSDMVINLFKRAPRTTEVTAETEEPKADDKPKAIVPDPDSVEVIGLNMRGEEVVRDSQGRFIRVTDAEGTTSFIHESEGGRPALFLRARKPEDLNGVAAGIVRMARKGTLHRRDLDRVLAAALEEGPAGKIVIDQEEAFDLLREQMLRQITSLAIEGDNERSSFIQALRISANSSFVISRQTQKGEDLRPGISLLSLIRRQARGHDRVDFRGDRDLGVALPRLSASDASLQVQDFSEVSEAGMTDYAMNVLSRRPAEGNSIFIVPADIDEDNFERLRSEIDRNYGLEAVAEIAPGVADGVRDGREVKMFFVGDRRPEALDALPQAALRSITVATDDDLVSLEREITRSRGKIREFNRGEVAVSDAAKLEDERAENTRQRPYQPLSRVGEPFTMIPRALEGATAKALNRCFRDAEPYGGIDAMVAQSLGRSVADLGDILTPEQVDAVALRMNAAERGRGFLEADQTGVGKGRTMSAIMKAHLREKPENRCLYVTESAAINVPDVLRDTKAVDGLKEARVLLLTSGSEFVDITVDAVTGEEIRREIVSIKPKQRRELFERGVWPEGYNLVITTYSQFNVKEDAPQAEWLANIAGDDTMFILDEAHNALNPRSNTGRNFRKAINRLKPENVAFATGTPSRNPQGMDLYKPLLPQGEGSNVAGILENIASGGEVAQEAFATMLAEDGVMIRRDHDLSATDYVVNLPDDQKMLEYQDTMNRFSPIVEGMIDVSTQIGEIVGRVQAIQFRQMVNAGMDERQARSATNELSQYSLAIGGPLSNLARIMMNAIKVDQVVEAAIAEMDQGRKPLITFHSTNAALLNEMSRDEDGNRLNEEDLAALPEMTIRDQIRRIHNGLYKMKIDGETLDPRANNSDAMRALRQLARASRGRNGNGRNVIAASQRLQDAIAAIDDGQARDAMSARAAEIDAKIVPHTPLRDVVEAYTRLSSISYYDEAECQQVIEAYEDALNNISDELEEDHLAELEGIIIGFRATTEPGTRRELVTDINEAFRKIVLPRVMNDEIKEDLAAFEADVDALGGDRDQYDAINEAFARIDQLINEIPDLPVSPVDALIERLEANNIRTGEISGRTLCYRENRIQKRGGRNRKEIVDSFNGGDIDALLYNSAGATGGSYHAGATFTDQRPRSMIEFEAPIDIIKYVQAQGRGNRYDQVASPKVVSVMTGLTPEMRILQQRNGKLRSLGASVDGNRSHPLLLDDVPDLLNRVGDEATRNVLLSSPALARRLGFPKFAEEDVLNVADVDNGNDEGSGVAKSGLESLANKVLARSIMLPAHEQDDLIQRIRMEFDVLIEELESRNANPLRPKEFGGTVDIRTTTIFSGQELEEDDLDTSVFLSPVYMSTGNHDLGEDPVAAERLVTMVERAITMHGSDGLKPYADRINQNLAGLMRPYLPNGHEMDAALTNPAEIPGRFAREYHKITDLAWVLENLQPGVSLRFPSVTDMEGFKSRTVVDLVPPKDPSHYDMPSAYKIKTICPGDSRTETIAVSRIMSNKMEDIRFRPGISDGFNDAYLREFSEAANLRQQMPVQILGGNILQAITTANEHSLGTVSLYRDTHGAVHRGIVVHDSKIDMTMLPVVLPNAVVASEVATQFARAAGDFVRGDASSYMRIWGSMEDDARGPGPRDMADIIIRLTGRNAKIDMQPLRRGNMEFYESRPGLYEAIHNKPIPETIPTRAFRKPGTNHKYLSEFKVDTPAGRDRLYTVLSLLGNIPMMTDGTHRDLTNETMESINRDGPRGLEGADGPITYFFGEGDQTAEDGETFTAQADDEEPAEWAGDLEGLEF